MLGAKDRDGQRVGCGDAASDGEEDSDGWIIEEAVPLGSMLASPLLVSLFEPKETPTATATANPTNKPRVS